MQIKLLINSVDRTGVLPEDSWEIDDHEGSIIDTMDLILDDPDLSYTIAEGQEIVVEDSSDAAIRFFAGLISDVSIEPEGLGRLWHLTAQDWKLILDRATFTKDYVNQTDQAIIQNAFTEAGITEINTADLVESSRTLDKLTFRGSTLRQMMETISSITGLVWDVDKFKKLVYRTEGRVAASFYFSDNPNEVTTFPYANPLRKLEIGQFNAVRVEGARQLSGDTTNIFSGDGTQTYFDTRKDGWVSGNEYPEIYREPTTATDGKVDIDVNTGTDGSPVWTAQTVAFEDAKNPTSFPPGADVLWNLLSRTARFAAAPPNFANNSWRLTGRFISQVIVEDEDASLIATMGGRIFRKVLIDPSVEDIDTGVDVVAAFLRAQGPKDRVLLNFDKDGLNVGETVRITSTKLVVTDKPYVVKSLTTRLLGGIVASYHATLGAGTEFPELLSELRRKAGSRDLPASAAITILRRIKEEFGIASIVVNSQARGPAYYVEPTSVRRNYAPNPSFEVDLSTWTENINATGTTGRDTSRSQYGSASLKIEMTDSGGVNEVVERLYQITASAGQVWSLGVGVDVTALSLADARLRLQWVPSGTIINAVRTTVTSGFIQLEIENETAPAGTTAFTIRCLLRAAAAGGSGIAFFDGVLVEKASSLGSYFDGFQGNGWWTGTPDASISFLDVDGEAMIVGFFTASGDAGSLGSSGWVVADKVTVDRLNAMLMQYLAVASRPAAGELGRSFIPSDAPRWDVDDGSAWQTRVTVDDVVTSPSLRTLGTGAQQAAVGNHIHS